MIFYSTAGEAPPPSVVFAAADRGAASQIFQAVVGPSSWLGGSLEGYPGEAAEMTPPTTEVREEFDWANAKVMRKYVALEQKVLANQASAEEHRDYESMKRNRNGVVFAERYAQDYAEVQRLRKLSEKLAEIQQYLRPIRLG